MEEIKRDYRGHTILFQPTDLRFHISGPEFNSRRNTSFPSFDEARTNIDKEVNASERLRARNVNLNLSVITDKGERVRVTAIDRRTGDLKDVTSHYVYPDVPWVANTLKEYNDLCIEANKLDSILREVRIDKSRAYGRIDTDDYVRRVEVLKEEYNKKLELAKNPQVETNVITLTKE